MAFDARFARAGVAESNQLQSAGTDIRVEHRHRFGVWRIEAHCRGGRAGVQREPTQRQTREVQRGIGSSRIDHQLKRCATRELNAPILHSIVIRRVVGARGRAAMPLP